MVAFAHSESGALSSFASERRLSVSVGGKRRRLSAQLAQRVPRGPLLGFFLVASPGRLKAVAGDLAATLKHLLWSGPFSSNNW